MKGGSTTAIDAVVKTLLEAWKQQFESLGVSVLDGSSGEEGDQPDHALIIAPSDPDIPGMIVTYGTTKTRQPVEQIEIALVARSYAGDRDMSPRRALCAKIFAGVQEYVRDNPHVDGRWDQIEMGPNAYWHPVLTTAGANCYVGFSIVTSGLL